MTAFVDDLVEHPTSAYRDDGQARRVGARNGDRWCHLYADTVEELHAFAARIGMKRAWFQTSRSGTPHYDLTPGRRAAALKAGAVALDRKQARALRERLRGEREALKDIAEGRTPIAWAVYGSGGLLGIVPGAKPPTLDEALRCKPKET